MSLIKIENQWLKAAVDQPLHMLWGGVPWWWAAHEDSVPAYLTASLLTAVFIARELEQWPSKRWWDPPLDWLFFGIGTGLGIWLGLR